MKLVNHATLSQVLSCLVLGAALTGVGCMTKGNFPVVSMITDPAQVSAASMTNAPADADYFLYRNAERDPLARTPLKAGDPLGFKVDARDTLGKPVGMKGSVAAVAGAFVVPLAPGAMYEWRRVPRSSSAEKARWDNPLIPQP